VTINTLLGSGEVIINGHVQLTVGDVLQLLYTSNNYTQVVDLGPGTAQGAYWAVQQIG